MRTLGPLIIGLAISTSCKKAPSSPPLSPPAPIAGPAAQIELAPPPDAPSTPTGLKSKVLRPGTGHEHPEPQDLVEIHYTGWKSDGTIFDSSLARSAPVQFTVEDSIKGWAQGVQMMVTGETRRLWVPAPLAYGDHPPAGVPGGPLVFDLELLKIIKRPRPLPAPADLANPPVDAKKTKSGLRYKVLTPGTGKSHPRPQDVVEFHYTGWGPDGRMFDSSVNRGAPNRAQLSTTGKGWSEALSLMVAGEKARFWIPPALAQPMGVPVATAVYEIELIALH
jgi:FKBP-type peptidyl-prolyl cis-trans isomerase